MEQLLRANARTNDPERVMNLAGDRRHEQRLGRLVDVRKRNRPARPGHGAQLLRDWLRVRYGRNDRRILRIFHAQRFVDSAKTSISGERGLFALRIPETKILQFATNCFGDSAKTRHELSKRARHERLFAIALREFRRVVHFDHESVGARCDRSQ